MPDLDVALRQDMDEEAPKELVRRDGDGLLTVRAKGDAAIVEGDEPSESAARWREANECKYLFTPRQSWTRVDGRAFAKAAWNYLGYKS